MALKLWWCTAAGGQLSVLGQQVRGMRVLCWWPGDLRWFAGALDSFDPTTFKHRVLYDDGDDQKQPLYKELVRLLTTQSSAPLWVRMGASC